MKKLFSILMVTVAVNFAAAQSAFDKFEDKDGVTSVIVNKKMFEMMSKVKVDAKDAETQQYLNLLKKLDNLKVFTTSNNKIADDMKNTVNSYLKSNPLEELMRVNNEGKNVKIYVNSNGNSTIVKELLMFIEGNSKDNEAVVLSLTGNFDLDEISVLTDKMKLPGGNDLKNASKK